MDLARLDDPYALYATLRRDQPVHRIAGTDIWLVSRHADVVAAAGDPVVFSSGIAAIVYAGTDGPVVLTRSGDARAVDVLATQDPPAHTMQRRLVAGAFARRAIEMHEPFIRDAVDRALDEAIPAGRVEWMSAVADPLPVATVARILGLPERDDADLRRWAAAGIDLLGGTASAERMAECGAETDAFLAYLRARLGDPSTGGLTADVAAAVSRGELSEDEGASLLLQLVIAGSESTAALVGNAVRIIAERADVQARLRAHPGDLPAFLEEVLRLESPFRGHFRVTTADTELGGVRIPAGARVMLLWASANRDPDAFADPDTLNVTRARAKSHLAFGSGIHFCVGAALARLEARVAVERLLARTTWLRLAGRPPRYVPSLFVRRLASLPLALSPR